MKQITHYTLGYILAGALLTSMTTVRAVTTLADLVVPGVTFTNGNLVFSNFTTAISPGNTRVIDLSTIPVVTLSETMFGVTYTGLLFDTSFATDGAGESFNFAWHYSVTAAPGFLIDGSAFGWRGAGLSASQFATGTGSIVWTQMVRDTADDLLVTGTGAPASFAGQTTVGALSELKITTSADYAGQTMTYTGLAQEFSVTAIPEPSSMWLAGVSLALLGKRRR